MNQRSRFHGLFSARRLAVMVMAALSACHASRCLADIPGPRGVYVLGSGRDNSNTPADERLIGIRDYDFVDGYTLRLHWEDIDLGGGVYDFDVINEAIALLETNQNATTMNLEVLLLNLPSHIMDNSTETWEHFKAGTLPVPWDPVAQQGYADLIAALATHSVYDSTIGANVPLAQHPTLGSLNASVPGISGIRDNGGTTGLTKLVDLPNYTRQTFIDAVVQAVDVNRSAFSNQFGFLGYFSMTDNENANFGGETLNETLIGALLTEFNNPGQPHVGLFQELLSDVGPNPTNILGENLLAAKSDTYIMFQALASWLNPHTGADKVTSMNPSNGIDLGFNNYGATFFELYLADIDGAQNGAVDALGVPLIDGLEFWHELLEALAADYDGSGIVDANDYDVWKNSFGSTSNLAADGNGNGIVDAADYAVWLDNLGAGSIAGSATSQQTVPEPSAVGILLIGLAGVIVDASQYRRIAGRRIR